MSIDIQIAEGELKKTPRNSILGHKLSCQCKACLNKDPLGERKVKKKNKKKKRNNKLFPGNILLFNIPNTLR